MTPGCLKKLRAELKQLKFVDVPINIQDIETAREHGDLRENAEYHAAKDKQGHLAARIKYVEGRVALAEVINPLSIKSSRVTFGATVTLEKVEIEEEVVYQIVGEDESNPSNQLISIKSPLARAMLGKEVDDEFQLKTSIGITEYAVVKIEYK
jgi:transcription elongation factor GreA